jgi:hypothetical protein
MPAAADGLETAPPDPFGAYAAIPDSTLAEIRGGLRVNGFDIDLAVRIETRINDRLQMVSTLLADANDRIQRRTEVLIDRLAPESGTDARASQTAPSPTPQPVTAAAPQRPAPSSSPDVADRPSTNAASPRAKVASRSISQNTVPSQVSGRRSAATPTAQSRAGATSISDKGLSVRHLLEGTLGTQVVNRLNNQRVMNRVEMKVTLRNYDAIRQRAQRVRALSSVLRAATPR